MRTFWAWRVVEDSRAGHPKQRMAREKVGSSFGHEEIFFLHNKRKHTVEECTHCTVTIASEPGHSEWQWLGPVRPLPR